MKKDSIRSVTFWCVYFFLILSPELNGPLIYKFYYLFEVFYFSCFLTYLTRYAKTHSLNFMRAKHIFQVFGHLCSCFSIPLQVSHGFSWHGHEPWDSSVKAASLQHSTGVEALP